MIERHANTKHQKHSCSPSAIRWNIDVSHCGFNSSWVRDGQSKLRNVKVQKVNIKLLHSMSLLIITICHLKSGFTSSCSVRCRIRWVWTFSPNTMEKYTSTEPCEVANKQNVLPQVSWRNDPLPALHPRVLRHSGPWRQYFFVTPLPGTEFWLASLMQMKHVTQINRNK